MRLSNNAVTAIIEEVGHADPAGEVYLFGSRTNDSARGGDIDLLVVSEHLHFRETLQLRRRILDRIGWQQMDLLVRRRAELTDPLALIALEEGIKL